MDREEWHTPTFYPKRGDQYMLVAKPIADLKAHLEAEVEKRATTLLSSQRAYRNSMLYAIQELKILGDLTAYQVGWNAAIEAAQEAIRNARSGR